MTNIENILYPDEALDEYKKKLLEVYLEDYGEEYKDIIIKRMNNTLYLFDSNPKDTLRFILNNDSIKDINYVDQAEINYYNYKKALNRINKRLNKDYYSRLANYFNIDTYHLREDIMNLDYSSFNLSNMAKLNDESVSKDIKEDIIKRQEQYIDACHEAKVEPLVGMPQINILERAKALNDIKRMKYLVKHTNWGKQMCKKFKEYDSEMTIDDIVGILLQKEVGAANFRLDDNYKAKSSIVYYPIMKNANLKCLDRMFFHENRHVVEAGKENVGINLHHGNKYQLINEIRTEKHAISDADTLKKNVLWSNDEMPSYAYNGYEKLFPYTYNFFEENKEILDDIAMYGDVDFLEDYYGKINLENYERFLQEISQLQAANKYKYKSREKEEEAYQLVHSLNRNKFLL